MVVLARKHPKYTNETGVTLGYQRAVRARFKHIAMKKLDTSTLGLALGASQAELHGAIAGADEAYQALSDGLSLEKYGHTRVRTQ